MVVPVRVVEPIPPRGGREVIETKFGQHSFQRQNGPQLVLPERPNRVSATVINNNGANLAVGHSPEVAFWTGALLPANSSSAAVLGQGAVYALADPTAGAATDAIFVSTVDQYIVRYSEDGKRQR